MGKNAHDETARTWRDTHKGMRQGLARTLEEVISVGLDLMMMSDTSVARASGPPAADTAGGPPLDPGDKVAWIKEFAAHEKRMVETRHNPNPDDARRMAELYELADDLSQAEYWWRCAASLGDAAAQMYMADNLPYRIDDRPKRLSE